MRQITETDYPRDERRNRFTEVRIYDCDHNLRCAWGFEDFQFYARRIALQSFMVSNITRKEIIYEIKSIYRIVKGEQREC